MKIIAVVNDLFFAAKIRETANQLGIELLIIRNKEDLFRQLGGSETYKLIVDLNFRSFDILGALREVKKKHTVYKIGYFSHVQVELRKKAEKCCDLVLPRSAFSERLPELLS